MNLVVGDRVDFTLKKFEGGSFYSHGRYRKSTGSTFVGEEEFSGKIEREYYDTHYRHWFSIRLGNGKVKRVQGKNLYPGVTSYQRGADHAAAAAAKTLDKELAFIDIG